MAPTADLQCKLCNLLIKRDERLEINNIKGNILTISSYSGLLSMRLHYGKGSKQKIPPQTTSSSFSKPFIFKTIHGHIISYCFSVSPSHSGSAFCSIAIFHFRPWHHLNPHQEKGEKKQREKGKKQNKTKQQKKPLLGNRNNFKCNIITIFLPFLPPLGLFSKPYNVHLNLQLLRDTTRRWERFD